MSIYTFMENLFKEPYTLPTIVITVAIAVFITHLQETKKLNEEKEEEQRKKIESSENVVKKNEGGSTSSESTSTASSSKPKAFALPETPLPPPNWSRIFTHEELAQHDGSKDDLPIYVAIKGTVFDVTTKKAMYGPSGGYHCFAGKDASKALGMSSLKAEDCIADYSTLSEKERKTLDDWYSFFEKRYPIVGKTGDA
ncbi:cytochrome b5-like heme/steroid binding domain-containing protein [Lobosporangium transversale]|uniref:Cytochrome b5-like heme/steroid binding domain-containing protein n=1 Tax=Lobosporangium transversale TaxID=64571 RepID=A0A1Y2GVF1_9FUNG|nr:cytochrome b5-like heme/steroid binding domain-containing protein [Lobosporangium transversale]ORZ26259.1 cytochrome b5-like heme/steroid binding domain-containing protein [Lobosporangium transversale]|eukprot:XP_021884024.1 cytochrome b5-like heme/steroid binding domain-containing protein [Lobosporangium transversale]